MTADNECVRIPGTFETKERCIWEYPRNSD